MLIFRGVICFFPASFSPGSNSPNTFWDPWHWWLGNFPRFSDPFFRTRRRFRRFILGSPIKRVPKKSLNWKKLAKIPPWDNVSWACFFFFFFDFLWLAWEASGPSKTNTACFWQFLKPIFCWWQFWALCFSLPDKIEDGQLENERWSA